MDSALASVALILIALVAANAPFLSERVFLVVAPKRGSKSLGWRLLEVLVLYLLVGVAARLLEARAGSVYPQNWEFYVITLCLFLVFAYPGFVYRYLWRRRAHTDNRPED